MMIKKLVYCPECKDFSTVDDEHVTHTDDIYLKTGNELLKVHSYTRCKKCNKIIPIELDLDDKYEF